MYKCEKCGRSFSRKCDKTRHQNRCKKIYLHMEYECFIDEDGNEVFVHRYIMEQKLGRKLKPFEDVHHKDENKRNNDPQNLEVIHKAVHTSHHWKSDKNKRRKNMRKSKLENWKNIHGIKLTPEKVKEIKSKLQNNIKMTTLSKEYGVSYETIKDIKYERTWSHI